MIDVDGLFHNLHPKSARLTELLHEMSARIPIDFFIGRKLKQLLSNAGFKRITQEIMPMNFQGLDLQLERELVAQRLTFAKTALIEAFGSPAKAAEFRDLYLSEIAFPNACLFYNLFVVTGTK